MKYYVAEIDGKQWKHTTKYRESFMPLITCHMKLLGPYLGSFRDPDADPLTKHEIIFLRDGVLVVRCEDKFFFVGKSRQSLKKLFQEVQVPVADRQKKFTILNLTPRSKSGAIPKK